eukprot:TRINITY_DN17786_c0_g1_i1.p2 TRINITY_DN17786_c0_g1~~TRINITY_DN17786_c0_g1_i1.p2  ORF type:complete len:128 (+),score=17.37 TRINITY_DN17786_c0_g1_i1:7-390(+)
MLYLHYNSCADSFTSVLIFFFNDTETTEIYTLHIVGSVRCVQETDLIFSTISQRLHTVNSSITEAIPPCLFRKLLKVNPKMALFYLQIWSTLKLTQQFSFYFVLNKKQIVLNNSSMDEHKILDWFVS